MLSNELINEFETKIKEYWKQEILHNPEFLQMLRRKEAGHGLANYIESKTQEELINIAGNRYQIKNEINKRSMGDFWIKEQNCNFFTPINIKTGIKTGNPNIVTIDKIIRGIAERKIDSYYLFLIKFKKISERWQVNICKILNLFNILDYIVLDLGPLQLMLCENRLYANIENIQHSNYRISDVLSKFCYFYINNYSNFIDKRERRKLEYESILGNFNESDPINQNQIRWKNE